VNPLYPAVAERAGHRCEYCRAPEAAFNFAFEVEHVHPVASGGDDTPDNLALSCRSCNAFKAFRHTGIDPESRAPLSLFHPRRDAWGDHFTLDLETQAITGRTPTGRATIAQLRMNSPLQLLARRQWMRLELFP
jgi:hypothetical protein